MLKPSQQQVGNTDAERAVGFPVAYKLALMISVLIVVSMLLLGFIVIDNQRKILEEQMVQLGQGMTTQLAESAKEPILADDRLALEVIAGSLTAQARVKGVSITSASGENLAIRGLVPDSAAGFSAESTVLPWHSGEALMVFSMPVNFRQVHVGSVSLSLDRSFVVDSLDQTVRTISAATLLMVLFAASVALWLGRHATRPIRTLISGSRAIHAGDYSFRFAEQRNDEIGLLMNSLNGMTEGLLHKEQVEKAFSRYVSPEVAHRVLNDLEQVRLGGERVSASVMFADIVGFTTITESMEPRDVNALLNTYFSRIDQLVQTHGGHVDKFMGDCAMAVFGVPERDAQHARHAVECALQLQRELAQLNRARQAAGEVELHFRIGINSGRMLAGNTGSERRMDYTVVGDAVNLASRLCSLAGAGEIVISEATMEQAEAPAQFGRAEGEAVSVRGKEQPVRVYRWSLPEGDGAG